MCEQLYRLNQFRLDAEKNYRELEHMRDRHSNSLRRVDIKMEDYHNIINAIRTEILQIIINDEASIKIEVLQIFNYKDEKNLIAKIEIMAFPPIYKSFLPLEYHLYGDTNDVKLSDMSQQGRIKELVLEWLRCNEDWSGMFEQPYANAERVLEQFVNDEAIHHFFKRKPIFI